MPRDWNKAYEANEIPWDKGYASPPLMEYLQRHRVAGRVLVPGCGTGHDVRALARQGADVVGMDIAPGAIRKAEAFQAVAEESYQLGDFLNLDSGVLGTFDWVVEHTCLCALEPGEREAYVDAVRKVLKPGGQYLAVFYREVADYQGDGPPHPISHEASLALFADCFEWVDSFVPTLTYPSRPLGAEEVVWMRLKS